jgi:hypothetical protein
VDELHKYATILAVFVTGCYVAAVVLFFGMLSLITNLEVIPNPHVGPVVGPVMTWVSAIVLLTSLVLIGRKAHPDGRLSFLWIPVGVGVMVYISFTIVGAALFGFFSGNMQYFDLAAAMLTSPFALVVAVTAGLLTCAYLALVIRRAQGSTRPLWPWERPNNNK